MSKNNSKSNTTDTILFKLNLLSPLLFVVWYVFVGSRINTSSDGSARGFAVALGCACLVLGMVAIGTLKGNKKLSVIASFLTATLFILYSQIASIPLVTNF